MRALSALLIGLAACGGSPVASVPFLTDRALRRAELEASLVNPANEYSQLRLANYATASGGWDALAEWNPPAEPITTVGQDLGAPLAATAAPLDLDIDPTDDAALVALGEQAFFAYPAQLVPAATRAVATGQYGVWSDAERGLGGLVRVPLANGTVTVGATCATCHAAPSGGALVTGLGNPRFDLGDLLVDDQRVPPAYAAAVRAWGPGRVDVTTLTGTEPVRIPDLRAVADLTYLQADATVRQRDLVTLAIRIDTLITTSHDQQTRPPRVVALALAAYLWSLRDELPAAPAAAAPGAAVFAATCAGCHAPPALTGDPIPLADIGTDPHLGESAVRGTGTYRVPSLHGVAARGLLFHDGALRSLSDLLDPARVAPGYAGGVRPGPVPGHLYGLDLSASDRADLLAYLAAL